MNSLECLLPDEPASEGPIQSCNRSKKWQQQNFEHFKIYPQKNCVCCNILLSNLRKKSVFLVLLYFSDYHSLCEILPGSIFLHQRCSWCQWRIARLEQLVGVSRLWGAISVHLLRAIQLLEYQMVRALCRFDTLGNSVSAHQWYVCTTDLWWVTGARCVSGATNAADSTHRAPVILI